jgi:hypothetical protein
LQSEPIVQKEQQGSGFPLILSYCVVHASALFAFLTFGMATNGLEFFYFYPRPAETILQPFTLHAMMWLGTASFSIFGLTVLWRFRTEPKRVRMNGLWLLAAILAASVSLALLGVLAFPDLMPFWWLGAGAVALCWLGLGSVVSSIFGDPRQLVKSFFASLLGIGAILEVWSLSHWLYAGIASGVTFRSVGSDLEMNLTYANSWSFPAIFTAAWLSPIWIYIAYFVFSRLRTTERKSSPPKTLARQELRLGLDDLILAIFIILICVFVGFYVYLHDPPWLVGTDAYWRYSDPLQRVMNSGNVLVAASDELHGLYLLILYGIHALTGMSPFNLVKASPMVLATLLSLLTYFGVAKYRKDRTEGFFAALFSATTLPTTAGVFGSIDANWLALTASLVTVFILVSLASSSQNAAKAILVTLCGIFLLILHPWTWVVVALFLISAGFAFAIKREWKMVGASWIVPFSGLASGILVFVFVLGGSTVIGGLTTATQILASPLSEQSLLLRPFDVIGGAMNLWASFLNPLLMILVMVGVLSLVRENGSSYKIYLLSWMLITGLGTFFGVTLQTEIWRIWYVQPLWLLGGVGVSSLLGTRDPSNPSIALGFEAGKTAAIIFIAGLAVFLLEPMMGASVFYVAAVSPVLSNVGRRRGNVQTVLAATLILFVCVFFLNHALRSLYPLMLNPHNFIEH